MFNNAIKISDNFWILAFGASLPIYIFFKTAYSIYYLLLHPQFGIQ